MRVWFPTIRANSGADVFTQRLVDALVRRDVKAEITWFPHLAELAPWLLPAGRAKSYDLVHANSWNAFAFGADRPLVVTSLHNVHDPEHVEHRSRMQKLYHDQVIRRYEEASFRRARAITTISHFSKASTKRSFGPRKITVIHPWVDTSIFSPQSSPKSRRAFRLLFVGNWSRRKGVDLLLPILERLGPGFELWIAAGLRGAPALTLPANVRLITDLPDEKAMADLYSSCDALLFPSRLEGFGYAPLEAHACGLPVVATNTSSIPEIVKHATTGFLCSDSDVEAFAEACRALADDRGLTRRMGEAGRETATQGFSEKAAIDAHIKLYAEVLTPGHT
jgi:glycosyltransferase involved in cell wall biosynthesis